MSCGPRFLTFHLSPSRFSAYPLGERLEELPGELLRDAVDQARADLCQLAADRGLGRVGEACIRSLRAEGNGRLAPGETRHAALALEAQGVGARGVGVGHGHLAFELGADRADALRHAHFILSV